MFPLSGWAGAAVRAVAARMGKPAQNHPVFTVDPARCARRQADDRRPRLHQSYTEDEIFTDQELARQFCNDLLRLLEANIQQHARLSAETPPSGRSAGRRGSMGGLPGRVRTQHRPAPHPQAVRIAVPADAEPQRAASAGASPMTPRPMTMMRPRPTRCPWFRLIRPNGPGGGTGLNVS